MATIDITLQASNSTVGPTPTIGGNDEVATETAYQLRVDQLTHSFREPAVPLILPTSKPSADQMRNQMITLGMRTEEIRLTGTLVDRGAVTAPNPRKQTILDIARKQWVNIIGLGTGSDDKPPNPNSYPLLTIGSGFDADGTSTKGYRGMISDLSFINAGGKPDIWKWQMTFIVIMNEHFF